LEPIGGASSKKGGKPATPIWKKRKSLKGNLGKRFFHEENESDLAEKKGHAKRGDRTA